MAFPLPVMQKREDVQEVQFSAEQLAMHSEEIKRQEAEAAKIREDDKLSKRAQNKALNAISDNIKNLRSEMSKNLDAVAKQLNEQNVNKAKFDDLKNLYGEDYRSGILGKVALIFNKSDKLLGNTFEAMKDGLSDKIFGKKIKDIETEADESKTRTTLLERAITGEKFKMISKPEVITKEDLAEEYLNEDNESVEPKKKPKSKPKSEPQPHNDVPFETQGSNKTIPLLENMRELLHNIYESFTTKIKNDENNRIRERNKKHTDDILSKTDNDPNISTEMEEPQGFTDKLSFFFLGALGNLMGTITSVVLGALMTTGKFIARALPIAALATSLYLSVKDAIGGWFSAESWGVSKISGMLGGLLGGLDDGVTGSLKGAGKWGIIGAGIGSVVPVIGTLIGGLVGAGFGAVLGYFGGEKIANFLDSIGGFFTDQYDKIVKKFIDLKNKVVDFFTRIKDFVSSITLDDIKEKVTEVFNGFTESVSNAVTYITSFSFSDIKDIVVNGLSNLATRTKEFIKNIFSWDYWWKDEDEPTPEKMSSNEFIREQKKILLAEGEANVLVDKRERAALAAAKFFTEEGNKPKIVESEQRIKDNRAEEIYRSNVNDNRTMQTNSNTNVSTSVVNQNSGNKVSVTIGNGLNSRNVEPAIQSSRARPGGGW